MNDEFSDDHLKPNYSAPSPQADDLKIVIDTLEGIVRGGWTADSWCEFYQYDKRQYDYYVNANRWLGFLEGTPSKNKPTKLGIDFIKLNHNSRKYLLKRILLQDTVFNQTKEVEEGLRRGYALEAMAENEKIWKAASRSTMKRRALTVKNWLRLLKL